MSTNNLRQKPGIRAFFPQRYLPYQAVPCPAWQLPRQALQTRKAQSDLTNTWYRAPRPNRVEVPSLYLPGIA